MSRTGQRERGGFGVSGHGGDALAVARALGVTLSEPVRLDFSVNVNPLGAPSWVKGVLTRAEPLVERYPEACATTMTAALAAAHHVGPDSVICGNGSTEILSWIVQALRPRRPAWVIPAYAGYAEACAAAGCPGIGLSATRPGGMFPPDWEALRAGDSDLLFLASPNNPTGLTLDPAAVLSFAASVPARTVVLDESFTDFLPDAVQRTLIRPGMPPNLIVVKSVTKFFAIPGLRLGLACAAPGLLGRLAAARLPWSVNGIAQAVGAQLYDDADYVARTRRMVPAWRDALVAGLAAFPGMTVHPSEAPFVLCRLPPDWTASRLQADLLRHGVLIRSCANFPGLGEAYCRLAVRAPGEQEELLAALGEVLGGVARPRRRRTPAIMVVGTTSHAGKSVVAAGLCRVFARRGLRVAPFKAQNMALNSYVTAEGGEMGRAQVTQARAARVAPHTDMNPVLLKPTGDTGSQIIVNGRAIGTMSAREYYTRKTELRETAHAAYDRLCARHELLVLEGAGSPAEINLREQDFVNLDMAVYAGARAVLVADIDRGGVFASIYGTLALLPAAQRRTICGVIINKFRGDPSLLTDGLREIEALTGVPVLGVLPYLADLQIEEEDSLGIEGRSGRAATVLDLAVVRLPRISNYTDFLALERRPGVRVRYVTDPRALRGADAIILPGSKNTRDDLAFLHARGFTARICRLYEQGIPVLGICGGYQMLGREVLDPEGVEGEPGRTAGLDLLPVTTTLAKEKELAQVSGTVTAACAFADAGTVFRGYEIHAGQTGQPSEGLAPLRILDRRGQACAEEAGVALANDGRFVFGAYVHGLFDEDAMARQFVQWLCRRKGIDPEQLDQDAAPDPDQAFDRVADMLEQHVDMKRLEEGLHAPA
jgi:cobyric acid synthase CobQ/L-threonine-O-3-phosphate decarboxylase